MDLSSRLPEISEVLLNHGYTVLRALGSGRFAQAFELQSNCYSERFCAKVLDNSSSASDDTKLFFESEVRLLISLIHPNIITVFETFESGNLLYLILEYAEGGTLEDKLHELKVIPPSQLTSIGRQIIEGLAYCHAEGIYHGDIKPANILLDHYGRPKIADFGLAAKYHQGESTKQTGSPCYMAPELLTGRAKDRFACDVWALGVTFFELAVGQRPFLSSTVSTLLKEIAMSTLEFPAHLQQGLVNVITQMLSFDARMRPTMAQLLENPSFTVVKSRSLIKFKSMKPLNFASQRALHMGVRKATSEGEGAMSHLRETFGTASHEGIKVEERK